MPKLIEVLSFVVANIMSAMPLGIYIFSEAWLFRLLPLLLSNLSSLVVLRDPILPLEHVPGFARQALHNFSCGSYLGGDVLDGPVGNGVRDMVYPSI